MTAGILRPPFFDLKADDAVNYGGIGAVIGHEITHGFDDQGSRSDAEGNLRNWWTPEDRSRFNAKTDKLIKQYNDCIGVDDMHGELAARQHDELQIASVGRVVMNDRRARTRGP